MLDSDTTAAGTIGSPPSPPLAVDRGVPYREDRSRTQVCWAGRQACQRCRARQAGSEARPAGHQKSPTARLQAA
eukprot:14462498-Alexandrium_andersonii.AAC.1